MHLQHTPMLLLLWFLLLPRVLALHGLDLLNNTRGQGPCEVNVQLQLKCSPETNVTDPKPSPCTCNLPFFNIWSACLLLTSGKLPKFSEMVETCANASFATTADTDPKYQGDIDIQTWAQISTTQGTNVFDVVKVVAYAAYLHGDWNIRQTLAPVFSSIGTIIFILILRYFLKRYRNRGSKTELGRIKLPIMWRGRKVKERTRQEGWDIEGRTAEGGANSFDETRQDNLARLYSVGSTQPMPISNGQKVFGVSGTTASPKPTSEHTLPGRALWNNFQPLNWASAAVQDMRLPGLSRPHTITSQARTKGFRVDDYDESTQGSETGGTNGSNTRKRTSDWSTPRSRSYPGSAGGTGYEIDREEQETLITEEDRAQNSVLLITTEPGVDFSISSGSTPRKSPRIFNSPISPGLRVTFEKPGSANNRTPILRIPPAPSIPAALPPAPTLSRPTPTQPDLAQNTQNTPTQSLSNASQWRLHPQTSNSSLRRLQPTVGYPPQRPSTAASSNPTGPKNKSQLSGPNWTQPMATPPAILPPQKIEYTQSHDRSGSTSSSGGYAPQAFTTVSSASRQAYPTPAHSPSQNITPSLPPNHTTFSPPPTITIVPESVRHPSYIDPFQQTSNDSREDLSGYNYEPSLSSSRLHTRNISVESFNVNRSDPIMLFSGSVRGAGYNVPALGGNGLAFASTPSLRPSTSFESMTPSSGFSHNSPTRSFAPSQLRHHASRDDFGR